MTVDSVTIYHYDQMGMLVIETTETGVLMKDYVWNGGVIAAQITAMDGGNAGNAGAVTSEAIIYLYTDHLMTNRLATDDNQQVVWRWEGEAFGNTPAEELGGVSVNLRFPGQYYDVETNLHYNWNRYYDPQLGRYITSDPIGLDGGVNTYSYAMQNPIVFFDLFGEKVEQAKSMTSALPNSRVMDGLHCMSDCLKKTIIITSGHRTKEHNDRLVREGIAAENSNHLTGEAADVHKLSSTEAKVRKAAKICGFSVLKKVYKTHIHLDAINGNPKRKADECKCEELRSS